MSDFEADSHFSRRPRQAICLFQGDSGTIPAPRSRTFQDDDIRISRHELENWYNEVNDLVRRMGVSTSTGSQQARRDSQKRAQRASSSQGGGTGSMDTTELHERLTDHRNALYRYLR